MLSKIVPIILALYTTLASGQGNKPTASEAINLNESFEKEYSYLDVELRLAKQRLKKFKDLSLEQLKEKRSELVVVNQRLANLEKTVDSVELELSQAEEENTHKKESIETIQSLYQKASERFSIVEKNEASFEEKTGVVFDAALESLGNNTRVTKTEGSYFLENGESKENQIIKIGSIAALGGNKKDGYKSLYPAGDSNLRVWPKSETLESTQIVEGKPLSFFVFEGKQKNIPIKKEKTALDVIENGGFIGLVILGLGLVALITIIFRTATIRRFAVDLKVFQTDKIAKGVIADVKQKVQNLRNWHEEEFYEYLHSKLSVLDNYAAVLTVTAAIAPLLGLLGTVTGMIATFDIITEVGTGDPQLLSSGISEALVTTMLGLIVAIPALFAGSMLKNWAKRVKGDGETVLCGLYTAEHQEG